MFLLIQQRIFTIKNPVSIEENRPFFLEDSDFFNVYSGLWHTRNIVSPSFAIKYTNIDRNIAYGAMVIKDNSAESGGNDFYNSVALKLSHDAMRFHLNVYGRQHPDDKYHNEVLLASLAVQPNRYWYFKPEFVVSYKRDEDTKKGLVGKFSAGYNLARFNASASYRITTENFAADMGSYYYQNQDEYALQAKYEYPIDSFLSRSVTSVIFNQINDIGTKKPSLRGVSISQGFSFMSNRFDLTISDLYTQETYNNQVYNENNIALRVEANHLGAMTPSITYQEANELVYSLCETCQVTRLTFQTNIDIHRRFIADIEFKSVKYHHEKTDTWDNHYYISNIKTTSYLSQYLYLTQGFSLTAYEISLSEDSEFDYQLTFYSNIDLRVTDIFHVYCGYNSTMSHYTIDLSPSLVVDRSKFYFKLQIEF